MDHPPVGTTRVTVILRVPGTTEPNFEADFVVDTGATDCVAPASRLAAIGVRPVGKMTYQLADGSVHEYEVGIVQIEFMGEITAGRVVFGPETMEPILGVTALESVGITVDPVRRTLHRVPALPLRRVDAVASLGA